MYEQNRVVAAVCHGPSALVNVVLSNGSFLVAGKKIAAFTDSEEQAVGMADIVPFLLERKLKDRGAQHQSAADWTSNVVIDGYLITGQNPQSALGVGEAIRDVLIQSVITSYSIHYTKLYEMYWLFYRIVTHCN